MTTQRDSFLREIQSVRNELGRLLEGVDYCCDWKPDDENWSVREVVYHLVDTPSGGIDTAVRGVLEGSIQEFPITAGLTNLTPERQERNLEQTREEVEDILSGLEAALGFTTDAELTDKKVSVHSVSRSTTEERTAHDLMEGTFLRHWRVHLGQLAALRELLGVD